MGRIGVSIEKEISFRGANQPTANVYYYRVAGNPPYQLEPVVDEIVTIEKNLHSTAVVFKYARVWSADGGPAQNTMLFEKPLTGTGVGSVIGEMDRERAVLFQWPAGKSVTGKPVKLRKWFHSCGNCATVTFSAGELQNTTALSDAKRNTIATEANKLRLIGPVDEWMLVSSKGREHTGPGECHKWLEHHQLGNQWR